MDDSNNTQPASVAQPQTPEQQKKRKKGLLWGIIGGVVGLLLLAGGLTTILILTAGPSEEDYEEVSQLIDDVDTPYREIGRNLSGIMLVDEEERETALKDYEAAVNKIDEIFEEIEESTAVKRDSELREAFETLLEEKEPLDTFNSQMIEVSKEAIPAVAEYTEVRRSTNATEVAEARQKIEAVEVAHEPTMEFLKKMATVLETLEEGLKDVDRTGARQPSPPILSAYQEAVREYNSELRTWERSIQTGGSEAGLQSGLRAFDDVLTRQLAEARR